MSIGSQSVRTSVERGIGKGRHIMGSRGREGEGVRGRAVGMVQDSAHHAVCRWLSLPSETDHRDRSPPSAHSPPHRLRREGGADAAPGGGGADEATGPGGDLGPRAQSQSGRVDGQRNHAQKPCSRRVRWELTFAVVRRPRLDFGVNIWNARPALFLDLHEPCLVRTADRYVESITLHLTA